MPSLACSQQYVSSLQLTAAAYHSPTPPIPTNTIEQPTLDPTGTLIIPESTQEPIPDQEPTGTQVEPESTPALITPSPLSSDTPKSSIEYLTQIGDSLPALASRFGVSPDEITSPVILSKKQFLNPGLLLTIPDRLSQVGPGDILLPDSEIIFSPTAVDFDINDFVLTAGGYLSQYREYNQNGWRNGAEIINTAALEYSINPRILLALLEYQSHWVFGQPIDDNQINYPMGYVDPNHLMLLKQMRWAAGRLAAGYYGWRWATLSNITFPDDSTMHLSPVLNAGTVALQFFFAQLLPPDQWYNTFYGPGNFPSLHESMLGNSWIREQNSGSLFPLDFSQPVLELPFAPGHSWNFTGGPHEIWGNGSAWAAIDFAPIGVSACTDSTEWVTSMAPGLVVRTGNGYVVVDMDGDNHEQTGWSFFYLHIAKNDRITAGTYLNTNDRIGHPSCEGGNATGTHVHIARKYNGEWMLAGGPLPFVLSGWEVQAGHHKAYEGTLIKNDEIVEANFVSSFETRIMRPLQ